MTTELVLLLGLFAFLVGGVFFGEKGPIGVFNKSGPRLAARVEKHLTVGREFKIKGGAHHEWQKPSTNPPTGRL
jgi:hypothetical protein